MKRIVLIFGLWILLLSISLAATKAPARIYEEVGDMTFEYTHLKGIQLNVHGVTVLKGSSLWAVRPQYNGQYYGNQMNADIVKTAKIISYKGGKIITLIHEGPKGTSWFSGTESFILLPNNTYINSLEYTWSVDSPGFVELTLGRFNSNLIINQSYTAITGNNQTINGVIPIQPMGITSDESQVARGFKEITINSKLGPIQFKADPKDDLILYDYRGNRWADTSNPLFWLGTAERNLVKGKKETVSITLCFPKKVNFDSKVSKPITLDSKILPIKNAISPWRDRDYIIPTPKSLQWTNTPVILNKSINLYLGANPTADTQKAVNFLVNDMSSRYGINVQVIKQEAPKDATGAILAGTNTVYPQAAKACSEAGLSLPDNPEGYCLYTDGKNTYVTASTEQGLYYGFTSLVQTVKIIPNQMAFKGVKIRDYPAVGFRGVHCLTSKDGSGEISKGIRDLMARFKMNNMVWECEYIIWDGHKELEHPEYGMTKNEARKVIKTAQENFIEITPLVQSLGHSAWIFQNGHNMDLAEDPDKPYAYMVTNPRTYDFIFSVYQEALDLFHPRYFHIGHDEVNANTAARYPYRSKDSGLTTTQLILSDIHKLHAWFKERNVKVMMWGDMFLHRPEAPDAAFAASTAESQERRAMLPSDIFITDWHYTTDKKADYPSLKIWKDGGHQVVGAGWDVPQNIRTHATAAARYGADGYLQTTWAGFNFRINNNKDLWKHYWAYILAAEYSWSGKPTELDQLPFEAKQVFLEYWFDRYPHQGESSGFQVNLTPVLNQNIKATADNTGWISFDPQDDIASLPVGSLILNECHYNLTEKSSGERALALYGKLNPTGNYPANVHLKFPPQKVRELHFLANATLPGKEDQEIGSIMIHYKDGSSITQTLNYGNNIFYYKDLRNGDSTVIAWKGKNSAQNPIAVWDIIWKNPTPNKPVKSIELISSKADSTPVFYAITGVY